MRFRILFIIIFFIHSLPIQNSIRVFDDYDIFQIEKYLFYRKVMNEPFSEELFIKSMYYENIKYPEVVLLQAQLETGFYKSDIFLNGNNLFGMKYPKFRNTVAIGTYKGHSQYEHWIDSVRDYKLWQEWYLSLGWRIDITQDYTFYMLFLKEIGYAEDPRYLHKLIWLNNFNANKHVT